MTLSRKLFQTVWLTYLPVGFCCCNPAPINTPCSVTVSSIQDADITPNSAQSDRGVGDLNLNGADAASCFAVHSCAQAQTPELTRAFLGLANAQPKLSWIWAYLGKPIYSPITAQLTWSAFHGLYLGWTWAGISMAFHWLAQAKPKHDCSQNAPIRASPS